jgi:hypothetical protein
MREKAEEPLAAPTCVHTIRLRHNKTETRQEMLGFVCSCGRICKVTDKDDDGGGAGSITRRLKVR